MLTEKIYHDGFTMFPNFIWKMLRDNQITHSEFIILNFCYAVRKINYRASFKSLELDLHLHRETISKVFKSLTKKKLMRIEKIDHWYFKIFLTFREKVIFEEVEQEITENNMGGVSVSGIGGCRFEGQGGVGLGGTIEERLEERLEERIIHTSKSDLNVDQVDANASSERLVIDEFNKQASEASNANSKISTVRDLTSKRMSSIKKLSKTRFKTIEQWKAYFTLIFASNFLTGRIGKHWKASFDWCLNENNIVKVFEGNYTNEKQSGNNNDPNRWDAIKERRKQNDARRT